MSDQVRRSRVVAAAAAVVMVLAGCGDGGGSSSAASSPTPSPTFDRSTMRACEYARVSTEGDGEKAAKATEDALSAAELSDVPALRQIAEKYVPDGTAAGNIMADAGALRIQTWCLDHGLSKP